MKSFKYCHLIIGLSSVSELGMLPSTYVRGAFCVRACSLKFCADGEGAIAESCGYADSF